jgi:hypothetical protein
MKSVSIALIIIGAGALVYGIIDFGNSRTTIEMGGMSASISENGSRWMFAVIAGGLAILAGLVLSSNGRGKA